MSHEVHWMESGMDENYSVTKLIGGVDGFISCYYVVVANYIDLMPVFFWSILFYIMITMAIVTNTLFIEMYIVKSMQ